MIWTISLGMTYVVLTIIFAAIYVATTRVTQPAQHKAENVTVEVFLKEKTKTPAKHKADNRTRARHALAA